MYEEYFGLTEKPFSIQPDPAFLYWGRTHRLAYAMLEYGVLNHAGISVITGEVGCGKTTLIHRLLDQLSDSHSVALLSNIQEGRGDLLSWVLMGFGQQFAGKSHVELFQQLQSFFIAEYAKGRRVVLIIDEAQNLSVDMLEELRMLSNINAGKDQLLQLILVGQPQLKDLLNRPDMLQLAQRIGSDFHLTPLNREEVDAYLDTRLTVAGAKHRLFTDRAVDMIAEHSGGVPRVINIIADTALVYAFSAQIEVVDAETVGAVIRDKLDYGVFGLATSRTDEITRKYSPGAPRFVRQEGGSGEKSAKKSSGAAHKTPPPAAKRKPSADDEPRMPGSTRRKQTQPQSSAALAPQTNTVNLVGMLTRDSVRAKMQSSEPPAVEQDTRRKTAETMPAARQSPASQSSVPKEAETPIAESIEEPACEPETVPLGVVIVDGGASPAESIEAAAKIGPVVFVAQSREDAWAGEAERAGADVLEVADRALSPGRARNAGYRRLKKLHPRLQYAQFVRSDFALDPGWLAAASRFMDRRPEVAVVEGRTDSRDMVTDPDVDSGEVQATGPVALVRADAFESAGGFRGDLVVNETQDLCIRLRRRGAHVWRLDKTMGVYRRSQERGDGWWNRALRRGYAYAHGADLHGAPPENFCRAAQFQAIFWGAALPVAIILGAVAAGVVAKNIAPLLNPFAIAGGVAGAGLFLYAIKIIVGAVARRGRPSPLTSSLTATLAHVPEFFGAWRFYTGARHAGAYDAAG